MADLYKQCLLMLEGLSGFATKILGVFLTPIPQIIDNLPTVLYVMFAPLSELLKAVGWETLNVFGFMFVLGIPVWVLRFVKNILD